eukprot:337644_1
MDASLLQAQLISQYEAELVASMRSAFTNTSMSNEDIISIIFEYVKIEIGNFKFHDAKHISLPSHIEIEDANPSHIIYQQIEMSEISKDFHSLFIEKPKFGDIILFDDCNYGFVDASKLWIPTTNK